MSNPRRIRIQSNGTSMGTRVVVLADDGSELDISNQVQRIAWRIDARAGAEQSRVAHVMMRLVNVPIDVMGEEWVTHGDAESGAGRAQDGAGDGQRPAGA